MALYSVVCPRPWGSNLAPDTRQWTSGDFNGNNAPTSLDSVQVIAGGQKAFIDYISSSPGQINAQLPSNIATGATVAVTVTNGAATSSAFNVTVNSTQPGLLAPAAFQIGGKQYVAALLPDGATYVAPTGAIAGVTSRPAHPGETITMYGIGFGPVVPNISAGQIVTESNQLASSLQILFGQTSAAIVYSGLSVGFVGLYQFNVVVSAVAKRSGAVYLQTRWRSSRADAVHSSASVAIRHAFLQRCGERCGSRKHGLTTLSVSIAKHFWGLGLFQIRSV